MVDAGCHIAQRVLDHIKQSFVDWPPTHRSALSALMI